MASDPFDQFDPSAYLSIPRLPLQTLIVLAKGLRALTPDSSPEFVLAVAYELKAEFSAAEAAMVERLRESNEISGGGDMLLDNIVDILWGMLRGRLLYLVNYEHPGLDFLAELQDPDIDLALLRDKAARAKALLTTLFGAGNLEMLNKKFPEQSQLMANVLALVVTDDLTDELLELGGPELLPILRRCQERYEAMVQRRSSRDSRARPDLRQHRIRLSRAIFRYNQAMLLTVDADDPDSVAAVEAALRPMVTLRPSSPGTAVQEPAEGEPESPESPEAEAPEADAPEPSEQD